MDKTTTILWQVKNERTLQDAKWGEQNHDDFVWHAILSEEVGEAAEAMLKQQPDNLRNEIFQIAAVCVAWLEAIDRRKL
jgi:NTP pyrophosphatase (non-canonical NTP hydrolase)